MRLAFISILQQRISPSYWEHTLNRTMFTLIHGNRQELLARLLAERLRADPLPLFEQEVVVVQSIGMARWLQLFLAEELGVAGQMRFVFPAGYIWGLFGSVLPDLPQSSPFAKDTLVWRLLRLLGDVPNVEELTPLRHYLADGDVQKRYGLAKRLAETFDRYLAYRPDWVSQWLQGRHYGLSSVANPHEPWQAWLWQALAAELPDLPHAHPQQRFFNALDSAQNLPGLPRRISLFGIGAMPPPYLDIFRRIGARSEVTLYLLNPCQQHWGDVVASRENARNALTTDAGFSFADSGHALLGSLGKMARQCFDLLSGEQDVPVFLGREESSLLALLQNDLLELRNRGTSEFPPQPLVAGDASVQIHICHSPAREVEVLHDRLLALLAADSSLSPNEVLVLVPDINTYAPVIEAVFSAAPMGRRIPFTLADRVPSAESELLRAFNALLDLAKGRFDAESVLAFMGQASIMARFGFDEDELELMHAWVRESGIRWGLDADWRAARGLPAERGHTWRQGLERMLLGYALPAGEGRALFQGLLPYDAIEGNKVQILGRFISVIEALAQTVEELNRPRSVAAWSETLQALLLRFCCDAEKADELTRQDLLSLREALLAMQQAATASACEEDVPLDVVRRDLDERLAARPPVWAFLGGGVSFAALRPYRAVPMRVLCLLGMNDGDFPRNPAVPSFDLIAAHPREGDRNPRDEDRHAFLEALLSARDVLHLSYVGRSIRDNAELPPSAVLSELIDCIDRTAFAENGAASASISVAHPLQAFSRHYFDGSQSALFSYAEDYARASRAASKERQSAQPFVTAPLAESEELLTLTPAALIRFLNNPARHLLQGRLGIQLAASEGLIETTEPFVLGGLERYRLNTHLVEDACAGLNVDAMQALASARGHLPHGSAGAAQFAENHAALASFAGEVAELAQGEQVEPVSIDFSAHGVRLQGSLAHLSSLGVSRWRVGKARAQDLLALWVQHLLLNLVAPTGVERISCLLTPTERVCLQPLDNADSILADLLAIYRRGCCELLPFFPRTSLAWLKAQRTGKGSWQKEWERAEFSNEGVPASESEDAYFDLAFRGCEPFDEDFQNLAAALFAPLLDALNAESEAEVDA